jgi:peptide/nickel transport system permease protein
MVRFIINRLLLGLLIIFGASILIFALLHLAPGDPAVTIAGPFASQRVVEATRIAYGLDRPLPVQYLHWLARVLQGDLGRSPVLGTPVGPLVLSRFGNTLILAATSLLLAIVAGVGVGLVGGRRPGSLIDRLLTGAFVFLANIPQYLFGLVIVYVFSLGLALFPASGMYNPREPGGLPDLLRHLVLPAITVALGPMSIIALTTRGSVLEVSQRDYVRMALAGGLSDWKITFQYILGNALPPIISVIGLQAGTVLGGSAFVEVVFSWPGLGLQLFNAVIARDITTVQAASLMVAIAFILVNLITDIAVMAVNPRATRPAAAQHAI